MLVTVFAVAIFANAALLFSVQPLFTKMVLPLLGGSPAVWNTCLLFFQTLLLAGYLYAHVTSRWLTARKQATLHLALLLLALFVLPIHVPNSWIQPPESALPIVWLLGLLMVALGLPFFLLSAGAPMLQRWFAESGHPSAANPYFLYAASNLGSFGALLAYPFVIEPRLRISQQSAAWLKLYWLLLVLIAICAVLAYRTRRTMVNTGASDARVQDLSGREADAPTLVPSTMWRIRWVLWSFAPSSMLIGTSTYLSTDIASVPFLWVIPLSLYLLTFVMVFARHPPIPQWLVVHAQLLLGLTLVVALCLHPEQGIIGPAVLHLLAFFTTALMCHGELARSRPQASYLTEFYLWMSFGGMLGGVFNVLVAPILFDSLHEYAIAICIAFALRPAVASPRGRRNRIGDVLYPLAVGTLILIVFRLPSPPEEWFAAGSQVFLLGMMFVVFFFWKRPKRLALGAAAMYTAVQLAGNTTDTVIAQDRSFFGMYRVRRIGEYHLLQHGTTNHGGQSMSPERRTEPLTYYYRGGPVSDLFESIAFQGPRRVAIVGLGAGAVSCHGYAGERWTFYEIDPLVVTIARTESLFTYLRDCPPETDVIVGDARLRLASAKDHEYDIIMLDAFSSDAVPAHLITREALALYLTKLRNGGAVAFHISNRYIDLAPVLVTLASDAGLASALGERAPDADARARLQDGSRWVVLAREPGVLANLLMRDGWGILAKRSTARLWTDDYSDVVSAIRW